MKIITSRWIIIVLFSALNICAFESCKSRPKDADLQTAITEKLRASNELAAITADVKDGVVTLSGECKDEAGKTNAENMAKEIDGVKSVINNCTIVPPAPAPVVIAADDPLAKGVADATKDFPNVKSSVKDGVITLTGEIKKADLTKLMQTLHTLKPKKIENQLTIK